MNCNESDISTGSSLYSMENCVDMEYQNLVNDHSNGSTYSDEEINPCCSSKRNLSLTIIKQYNLRPIEVKCLQSLKDLKSTCKILGLKFCDSKSGLNADREKYSRFIKQCSVEALYPYKNIEKLCRKLRLKFNNGINGNINLKHEVDLILQDKREKGMTLYLVKWKRRSTNYKSWIPEVSLLPKYHNLVSYYKTISYLRSELSQQMISYFYYDLISRKPRDMLTLIKLCALLFNSSDDFMRELSFTFTELREKCRSIVKIPISKLRKIQSKLIKLMQFSEQRKRVLVNLKEWERDINNFNPAAYVEVENDVDLEMAPTNFQFIHDYVRAEEFIEEPICFCNCDDCYENKSSCCPHDSDGAFPYNKYKRLQLLPGYPIYECNKLCKCDDNCINRVVQHGQKVKVAIFRTSNGCGWGLKTLEVIQKDQFVLEYLGEIITSEEAEARGEIYDFIGRTYLFDLDYGEGSCLYTVDAGHMGNAGHFINHSCDPNLHVFAVWINQHDPNLPRLALFSKRKINRGEELTFDYKIVKNRNEFGVSSSPPVGVECKCNAQNCRKYLF